MFLRLCDLYGLEPNLFAGFKLPFFTDYKHNFEIDREMIVDNILSECGQFQTMHTSPTGFNSELRIWSASRLNIWTDLFNTTIQEYKLVHNYDRTEEWSETRNHNESGENGENVSSTDNTKTTDKRNGTYTDNGSDTGTNSVENSKTDDLSVSAFNNGLNMAPREKRNVVDNNSGNSNFTHDYTQTANDTAESSTEKSGTDSRNGTFKKSETDEYTKKIRAYGNIGVTTAQQMLEEERKLALFSIVDHITQDFKKRFCIMIY